MENLYPLIGVCIHTKKTFIIHNIDFENKTVFNRIAQNGNGNSYDFEDIYFMENYENEHELTDFILNSSINYDNYDKIDGDVHIFNNRFNSIIDLEKIEQQKKQKELIIKELRIKSINNKIKELELKKKQLL